MGIYFMSCVDWYVNIISTKIKQTKKSRANNEWIRQDKKIRCKNDINMMQIKYIISMTLVSKIEKKKGI